MENICSCIKDAFFFRDSLKKGHPYVSKRPRNHESLFFVTKGTLLYEKNGVKTVISEGQVGYIEKGSCDISGAYLCDEVSYIATNFFFGETNECTAGIFPFKTISSEGTLRYPYRGLFERALRYCSDDYGSSCVVVGILLQIIGYLYSEYELAHRDRGNIQKYKSIEQAVTYMKDHFDNVNFKVKTLSEISGMSEKNFRRIFKALYGESPYEFLQKYRIEKSKFLLTNTWKSVSEIAFACGFSDLYGFSHCFKKHEGISPSKYRTKHEIATHLLQVERCSL